MRAFLLFTVLMSVALIPDASAQDPSALYKMNQTFKEALDHNDPTCWAQLKKIATAFAAQSKEVQAHPMARVYREDIGRCQMIIGKCEEGMKKLKTSTLGPFQVFIARDSHCPISSAKDDASRWKRALGNMKHVCWTARASCPKKNDACQRATRATISLLQKGQPGDPKTRASLAKELSQKNGGTLRCIDRREDCALAKQAFFAGRTLLGKENTNQDHYELGRSLKKCSYTFKNEEHQRFYELSRLHKHILTLRKTRERTTLSEHLQDFVSKHQRAIKAAPKTKRAHYARLTRALVTQTKLNQRRTHCDIARNLLLLADQWEHGTKAAATQKRIEARDVLIGKKCALPAP